MQLRACCAVRSLLRGYGTRALIQLPHASSSRPPTYPLLSSTTSSPQFQRFDVVRRLSTSPFRRAPWLPIVAIIGRRALRYIAMFAGSLLRRWYKSLPKDKRRLLSDLYARHKRLILAGGASLLTIIGLYYASHIERTPVTGRIRFITVTHGQLLKLAEFELEQHMALHSDHLLPDTDRRVKMVRHSLAKLLSGNQDFPGINDREWKVFVVDDDTVANAFVLPTGDIFVFTGMLATMENEEQLGIILSHEMAHTLLGHGLENMSYTKFLDWVQIVILAALWTVVPGDGIAIVTTWFYNLCQQTALELPYSRKLEIEADSVGLQLAAKACFDVRESYAYWVGMQLEEKAKDATPVPSIFSTHPDHGDRAQRLRSQIDDALAQRTLCNCPPLDLRRDPIKRADAKKLYINQQLALLGKV